MTSWRTSLNETKAHPRIRKSSNLANWGLPKLKRHDMAMCSPQGINCKALPSKMTLNIQHGNGVPVVVRGGESLLHGEGEQSTFLK